MAIRGSFVCCRATEWLRLTLVFCLGYGLRLLMEACDTSRSVAVPSDCTRCDCASNLGLQLPTNTQPRERFKPQNSQEVLRYQYFNSSHIHDNFDDDPRSLLLGHHKADIQDILHSAIILFNIGKSRKFLLNELINGYRRIDPLRGEEYILDVELKREGTHSAGDDTEEVRKQRLELVKPFGISQLVDTQSVPNSQMVHLILPVNIRHLDKISTFLQDFEDACLTKGERAYLLLVVHTSTSESDQALETQLSLKVRRLHQKFPESHIRSIRTTKPFSRSNGLDLGIKQLPGDVLVFLTDMDVAFTPDFLMRCRQNAIFGQQVYYPIMFGQYDPELVQAHSPGQDRPPRLSEIHRHTGEWLYSRYSVACMYNNDYRSVGGLKTDAQEPSGNDDHARMFNKHINSKLKVFRAMDPGLFQAFTDSFCNTDLPDAQNASCMPGGNSTHAYASKLQLLSKLKRCQSSCKVS